MIQSIQVFDFVFHTSNIMDSISSMFIDTYLISVNKYILCNIVEHLYQICDMVSGRSNRQRVLQLIPGLSRGLVDFF